MSGPSAPQQANGASGRPVRAPPVVSLAARAAAGPDSLTKGHGSGARAVTALGGVTVAFAAAAQASAWPIGLLIGLTAAFAAVALLNTALMTTAVRAAVRWLISALAAPAALPTPRAGQQGAGQASRLARRAVRWSRSVVLPASSRASS